MRYKPTGDELTAPQIVTNTIGCGVAGGVLMFMAFLVGWLLGCGQ